MSYRYMPSLVSIEQFYALVWYYILELCGDYCDHNY